MSQQDIPHWTIEQRQRVEELIDAYRMALHDCLNDLTEEEVHRRLVPSKTTLLGLLKHATFVEGVWFDQAVTGQSYQEIGIAATVDGSLRWGKATRSRRFRLRFGIAGERRERTSPDDPATRFSMDEDHVLSGPSSCRSSASLHNTPATPTSCVS